MQVSFRRMMLTELGVSSFINAVIFPVLIWIAPIPPPQELGGVDGVAMSLVKGTAIPVFLMTILLTLALRHRFRKGSGYPMTPSNSAGRLIAALPRPAPIRALLFVLGALATLMPLGVLVAWTLRAYPMTELSFLGFNVMYGLVIGLLVTPFIVLAVMFEPPPEPVAT